MTTEELIDFQGDWGSARYQILRDGLVIARVRLIRATSLLGDDAGRLVVESVRMAVDEFAELLADAEVVPTHYDRDLEITVRGTALPEPSHRRDRLANTFRSVLAAAEFLLDDAQSS